MENRYDDWSLMEVVNECSRKFNTANVILPVCNSFLIQTLNSNDSGRSSCSLFDRSFDGPIIVGSSSSYPTPPTSNNKMIENFRPFLLESNESAIIRSSNGSVSQVRSDTDNLQSPPIQSHTNVETVAQTRPHNRSSSTTRKPNKHRMVERKVYRLSIEELANDKWAWRKYGQKPIKGSPYPRHYYKCSTSKACLARKQVERSPFSPEVYTVVYTDNHHHPVPPPRTRGRSNSANPLANSTPAMQFGSDELVESGSVQNEEGGHNNILIPNSMVDPDLLMGIEQLMKIGGHVNENGNGNEMNVPELAMNMDTGLMENGFDNMDPNEMETTRVESLMDDGMVGNIWDDEIFGNNV